MACMVLCAKHRRHCTCRNALPATPFSQAFASWDMPRACLLQCLYFHIILLLLFSGAVLLHPSAISTGMLRTKFCLLLFGSHRWCPSVYVSERCLCLQALRQALGANAFQQDVRMPLSAPPKSRLQVAPQVGFAARCSRDRELWICDMTHEKPVPQCR